MASIDDLAADQEELFRNAALTNALAQRTHGLKPTGSCPYCGEKTLPIAVFCSIDCRDDWQKEQDAKKRNGKV